MDREHWTTVKRIFNAALEIPSSERDEFVASASNGDPVIEAEVTTLLKADREAGSYLESPLMGGSAETPSPCLVKPGDVLCDRFHIIREIGEGGMGHVFEALDSELAVNVALKVIRSEIASSPDALLRFRQEVRLARRITHPNVCRTFDIERQVRAFDPPSVPNREIIFLTMEFLEGETLDARIKRDGAVPVSEAIGIAREIADALQAAHKMSIVHQDLKPANIMLVPTGSLKVTHRAVVTDFGLAHFEPAVAAADAPEADAALRPSGTLAYMAPEQMEHGAVSSATDIYAFGLILFEMVVGKRVFPTEHFMTTMALRRSADRPLSDLQTGELPDHWRDAIEGCLHADPSERFQSAREVIDALEGRSAILDDHSKATELATDAAPSRPVSAATHREVNGQMRARSRRKWIIAAASGLAIVAITLIAGLIVRHRRLSLAHSQEESASPYKIVPIINAPGEADSPSFSPDGKAIAYLWNGGSEPHRDVYALRMGSQEPLRLTHIKSGFIGHPAWSADGMQIAFSRCDGKDDGIFSVPAMGGDERKLTSAACMQDETGRVAWLANGAQILLTDRCSPSGPFSIILFTIATGARQCLTNAGTLQNEDTGFDFALSPDGQTIAFTPAPPAERCEVYTVPLHGGSPNKLTSNAQCWGELMWSPDGESILFASTRTTLFTLNQVSVDGGPIEHAIRYQQVGSFTKDGRRVAFSERSGGDGPGVWRADLSSPGGSVVNNDKLIKIQSEDKDAQPSPDGSRIAWMSWRTGNAEIWTSRSDSEGPVQLTHLSSYAGTPRWSPDGKSIAFDGLTDNGSQIFLMDSQGKNSHTITTGPAYNVVPSWSRDGKFVYYASNRAGAWQVWKQAIDTGAQMQVTKNGGFDAFESADGQSVFFTKFDKAGIWNIAKAGGPERLVIADKPQFGFWGQWAVTKAGLYFLDNDTPPRPRIEFYSFATRRTRPVFSLSENPKRLQPGLGATMDGKTVYYTQYIEDDVIEMMEFRQ